MKRLSCLCCKGRRIRCDGAKPSCRRCAVYGVSCPGYSFTTRSRHQLSKAHVSIFKLHRPSLTAESLNLSGTLIGVGGASLSLGLDLHELAPRFFRRPAAHHDDSWKYGSEALLSVLKVMAVGFTSMQGGVQTRCDRVRAHEAYGNALQGVQVGLHKSEIRPGEALCLAVYLLAVFEVTVSYPGDQADWRRHLHGLQSMIGPGSSLIPRLDGQKSLSQSIDIALRQLQALAPSLDSALGSLDEKRDLDIRKLRVQVRKVHRSFIMAQNARDQDLEPFDNTGDLSLQCRRLTTHTCLLLTAEFLERSAAHLNRRQLEIWEASAQKQHLHELQRLNLELIVAECSFILGVEIVSNCDGLGSRVGRGRIGEPLTLREGLVVAFSLCAALGRTASGSWVQQAITTLLSLVSTKFCIPRAVCALARRDSGHSTATEIVDGLVLFSIGLEL